MESPHSQTPARSYVAIFRKVEWNWSAPLLPAVSGSAPLLSLTSSSLAGERDWLVSWNTTDFHVFHNVFVRYPFISVHIYGMRLPNHH